MKQKFFKIDKLIRDNINDFMQGQGVQLCEEPLNDELYLRSLKDKIVEEAQEVAEAEENVELLEELADVLEVIYALSNACGISMEEVEIKRSEKKEKRGGFDRKVYCPYAVVDADSPFLQSFSEKQEPLEIHSEHADCLFCQVAMGRKEVEVVQQFEHCYAIKDQFPVSKGHLLIIPNEHTEHWFSASEKVRADMIKALAVLKEQLDLEHAPQGYNIGANCGAAAGQSVMHLHLHLIPRYEGDMDNPRGGVRGVIPSKQSY